MRSKSRSDRLLQLTDTRSFDYSLHDNNFKTNDITFELTAICICKLKLGRSPGPDSLTAEHLVYAHQSLIYHLSVLLRGMATHSFVPQAFAQGLSLWLKINMMTCAV